MKDKQFNKSAVRNVISILQDELKKVREDIRYSTDDEKETENRIKSLKTKITEVGEEIVRYEKAGGSTTNSLRTYRMQLEKDLAHWREAFKQNTKDIRLSKDSLHVLEYAIETLKKEFEQ